ncbi:hypothetical protein OBBRIDRAFT_570007 [Obba rivulosa]|uniref:Uncharacterized protein n=1 Tax=Obba rivulosa TaxID=1052685 RepID=A0A8E2B3M3_9APHY|nr:hypothetical protein OBBRIDRAFT_570007 [Obba rivulosa]
MTTRSAPDSHAKVARRASGLEYHKEHLSSSRAGSRERVRQSKDILQRTSVRAEAALACPQLWVMLAAVPHTEISCM